MATLALPAAAGQAGAPPAPWHARLQACLSEAERAVAALLAVCEEPGARAALEVRLCCAARMRGTAHLALADAFLPARVLARIAAADAARPAARRRAT